MGVRGEEGEHPDVPTCSDGEQRMGWGLAPRSIPHKTREPSAPAGFPGPRGAPSRPRGRGPGVGFFPKFAAFVRSGSILFGTGGRGEGGAARSAQIGRTRQVVAMT